MAGRAGGIKGAQGGMPRGRTPCSIAWQGAQPGGRAGGGCCHVAGAPDRPSRATPRPAAAPPWGCPTWGGSRAQPAGGFARRRGRARGSASARWGRVSCASSSSYRPAAACVATKVLKTAERPVHVARFTAHGARHARATARPPPQQSKRGRERRLPVPALPLQCGDRSPVGPRALHCTTAR